jgi:feruloyl esterase
MKSSMHLLLALAIITGACSATAQTANTCAALAKLALPNTKITAAEEIKAGAYRPTSSADGEGDPADAAIYQKLPAFCRVAAVLAPSNDSEIKIEVWLPVSGWNGKFRGQGNGGFAGVIDRRNLAVAVSLGYASGGTDTGHEASGIDARWALNHPEKITDFGNRAVHEMTLKSKAIVEAYYGGAAKRSYFASCSDGGREALMEAQRFPTDYDGILAGAPANNWSHLLTNAVVNAKALTATPASYIPASKIPAISAAVLAACDKIDGVADGIVSDPQHCRFDPAAMLCKGADSDSCLTAPQIAAMKQLYAGSHDASGKLIFPGYVPGAEEGGNGWGSWIFGPTANQSAMYLFGTGYFSNMVYSDPKWDYKSFNTDEGLKAAMDRTSVALDSTNPDLKAFVKRGGKLILYHGWNDPAISALNTINYYEAMLKTTGTAEATAAVRLYMAPGVQHCAEGPGPDRFGQGGASPESPATDPEHNMYAALEQWVESAKAPETIIATKFAGEGEARHVTMTRPLCPYPQAAKYKGSGDSNDAANFTCVVGSK